MPNARLSPRLNSNGFTLIELIVSLAILMALLAGVLNLVAVDLLSLKLSRQHALLKDLAESELNRLQSLDFNDADLDTKAGVHSLERTTSKGWKVTIDWTVIEEESGNERIKVKRIDLVPYLTHKPIKSRTYVGRVFQYDFKE